MPHASKPVITRAEERPREGWDDPVRGRVAWYTLFSQDIAPTDSMSAGVAEVPAGGQLHLHRHAQPELYYILEGTGIMSIDGQERLVTAGAAIFIPGDAEHGIRGEGGSSVRLLYVFPTDKFSDVVYRFPEALPSEPNG